MNAAQEYVRDMAARNITEYLLREATRAAQDALVALLEESLTAASVALAAIEKLEHMKRERSGD